MAAAASSARLESQIRCANGSLEQSLAYSFALVSSVETLVAVLDLGPTIELPLVAAGATDQAELRLTAALYLASELEAARLLPVVEALAGLFASGGIDLSPGDDGARLVAFWRKRHERFTARERDAIFARLFGAHSNLPIAVLSPEETHNDAFEELLIGVCEEFVELERNAAIVTSLSPSEARLRVAALQLAENLLSRSGGPSVFARDILAAIQEALEILKSPPVQNFAGARSVWGAVEQLARRYLRERADVAAHLARGTHGQLILAWLADMLTEIRSGGRLLSPGEPVLASAYGWLAARLTRTDWRA